MARELTTFTVRVASQMTPLMVKAWDIVDAAQQATRLTRGTILDIRPATFRDTTEYER